MENKLVDLMNFEYMSNQGTPKTMKQAILFGMVESRLKGSIPNSEIAKIIEKHVIDFISQKAQASMFKEESIEDLFKRLKLKA